MLEDGLYEQLLTKAMADWLRQQDPTQILARLDELDPAESAEVVAAHLKETLALVLRSIPVSERPGAQITLANRLIALAAEQLPAVTEQELADASVLRELWRGTPQRTVPRPFTPLDQSALLINAPREPKLASELEAELYSADRVDLLCAFVVWSGVRVLRNALSKLRDRKVPFRVITTTYMGATEARALDLLAELGADIRVSYETRATRLHAKAWLFERNSGFSTGYVGSSNLSHSALHDGLEWNVRISQRSEPLLMDRFRAAFQTYWEEDRFETYDPDRFREAVRHLQTSDAIDYTLFDIRPHPFQERMLYELEVERERHDRWRNLVVAATGTGKTVLAALDYKRLRERWGNASLLFVAHRKEILDQSLKTFRHVLGDGAFGELYVGGHYPAEWKHVFASIQSLSADVVRRMSPEAFDVVIVDEFHHAAAPSYDRLLKHLDPRLLLGLTATPERADGRDVTEWFDGHTAVELRLWDAIDEGLLSPFQYFGVSDDTDLTQLEWKRGGYDLAQLEEVYTGNDARVSRVLTSLRDFIANPREMRALGFCVGIKHAQFMAERFNRAGIPALSVSGQTHSDERDQALRRLKNHEVNIIFAVDLYNEGVDVPEIDTVLFLRPTESLTVFLQQLGRGLRKVGSKAGLTVLDFIGQQHRRFRFDLRFRALTGTTRTDLERQINEGFPFLPSGCHIQLDRVARAAILDNVKQAIGIRRQTLVSELQRLGDISLTTFLAETGLELEDIYRSGGSWTGIRRMAGIEKNDEGPEEKRLLRGISRLLHIDDPDRIRTLRSYASGDLRSQTERETRLGVMTHYALWGQPGDSLERSVSDFAQHAAVTHELTELLGLLEERAGHLTPPLEDDEIPLRVHARYSRDEVLAALGQSTIDRATSLREGVRWDERQQIDLFFVTLNKSEKEYSPTTMYRDYAISPTLFHWESQSTTSADSPTGTRYVNHRERGSRIFIFARIHRATPFGTAPYLFLGPATYVSHTGTRPMAITWHLDRPLPPDFFQEARSVA